MKTLFISLFVSLFAVVLIFGNSYNSFSGSKHFLSSEGVVIRDGNKIVYVDNNSTITKKESKCIAKLTKMYEVVVIQ